MDIFLVLALLAFATLIVAWMVLPHNAPAVEQPALVGEAQPAKS